MAAIKKAQLEALEEQYGLEPDGLTYQHRCSRIAAIMNGEDWQPPKKQASKAKVKTPDTTRPTVTEFKDHPLYGKKLLITPLMYPDAKRAIAFDEVLGPEMEVRDFNAGERIYGAAEDVDRMVGDYEIVRRDTTKRVVAKTTFPKIGTEISWVLGKQLVPVVRGSRGDQGYIWSFPTQVLQVGDTLIQCYGLKTLIQKVFPNLLPKFSGKPMMSYIDGVTLAANIPMTEALIRDEQRKERIDAQAGII